MHHRVCEDCGEEFRPEIARCSDCGGTLLDVDEAGRVLGLSPAPPDPPADSQDDADHRPIFVGTQAAQLVPLADSLHDARIPFRLAEEADPERGSARFSLLVAEADRERALRALAHLLDRDTDPGLLHAVESRFDGDAGYRRCPACDTELPPGVTTCPECGLAVAGGPDA